MIKTLRITTIITAALASVFLIFPVVFGGRADEQVKQFLSAPGVVEKFKQAEGNQVKPGESQNSPLVKQAQLFASYLNPRVEPRRTIATRSLPITPPKPPRASAHFKLIGTSVHETRPEESVAFINEPGSGLRWVKPGDELGHVTIEQIKDGLIVYRDSEGNPHEEPAQPRQPEMSLLEGSASSVTRLQALGKVPPTASVPPRSGVTARTPGLPGVPARSPAVPDMSAQESAALENLVEKLKALQKTSGSDKTDSGRSPKESAAMMEKLISDFRSMRIDAQEARKLNDLGKKLNGLRPDPNRVNNSPGTKPAGPRRPIHVPPKTR
jgi:hypothetical protein